MIYTIMRRYGMIWIVLASAIGTAAALVVSALLHRKLCQRRTAAALRIRCDHGVAEERFVRIGGIDQWIGIRGEDRDNPVHWSMPPTSGSGFAARIETTRSCS